LMTLIIISMKKYFHYLAFEHIHLNRKAAVKGFKANTIGKSIKQLIIFLKNRKAKKIITHLDIDGFKIPEEEADAIYLTPQEINQILHQDLSADPHLEKYRDLLVFGSMVSFDEFWHMLGTGRQYIPTTVHFIFITDTFRNS
jgi:hypothetical protein